MDSNKNSFYATINKFQQTNFLKYYFIKMKPLSLSLSLLSHKSYSAVQASAGAGGPRTHYF